MTIVVFKAILETHLEQNAPKNANMDEISIIFRGSEFYIRGIMFHNDNVWNGNLKFNSIISLLQLSK